MTDRRPFAPDPCVHVPEFIEGFTSEKPVSRYKPDSTQWHEFHRGYLSKRNGYEVPQRLYYSMIDDRANAARARKEREPIHAEIMAAIANDDVPAMKRLLEQYAVDLRLRDLLGKVDV